ncbi:MAG: flagellar hook-length control protein FliK [Gammaproteobacteria bacterium]|nr:flagellar hook-length control protein FliK [Gammaproteobacteria bacterium]
MPYSSSDIPLSSLVTLRNALPSAQSLQTGQILKALVLGKQREGEITLQLAGKEIQAQIKTNVDEGQTLLLKVVEGGKQPILKLLNDLLPTGVIPKEQLVLLTETLKTEQAQKLFRPGNLIHATVIAQNKQGQTTLQVNNTVFTTITKLPLNIGQIVEFQVARVEKDLTSLKLLTVPQSTDVITRALRATLPRAEALPALLSRLGGLVFQKPEQLLSGTNALTGSVVNPETLVKTLPPETLAKNLPPEILALAKNIFRALPDRQAVSTPEGLKQAISNSGLFMENKLGTILQSLPETGNPLISQSTEFSGERTLMAGDFKSGLARLFASIITLLQTTTTQPGIQSPIPNKTSLFEQFDLFRILKHFLQPETKGMKNQQADQASFIRAVIKLLQQVESGLARIQLNQVNSLPTEDRPQTTLNLELPIRHGENTEVIELRIQREPDTGHQEQEKGEHWSATLLLNLEKLGPVRVRINIYGQTVSTTFWAEHQPTVALFNQHMEVLRSNLEEAGLNVGSLQCNPGSPPVDKKQSTSRVLLSTTA